jgi:hypothetical protein
MKELALALWAMTASHSEWPKPASEPVAIVRTAPNQNPALGLSPEERVQLRKALDRIVKCPTGGLNYNPALEFYVPEQKPECR